MGTEALIDFFKKYAEYFQRSTLWTDVFNWIFWGLSNLLSTLVDAAESLVNGIYDMLTIAVNTSLLDTIDHILPREIIIVLITMSLIAVGFLFMYKKEKPKVVTNILIAGLVLVGLQYGVTTLNQLTMDTVNTVKTIDATENAKYSEQILKGALIDLRYMDKNNYNFNNHPFNAISESVIRNIDINEKIAPNDNQVQTQDLYKNQYYIDGNGNPTLKEIGVSGLFALHDDYVYRYHIDFLSVYISLIAVGIVLFFTAIKVGRLVFELIVNQFLAKLFAATDLTSGQRVKEALKAILNTYAVLILITVILKLFISITAIINAQTGVSSLIKGFMIFFVAMGVLDGPNLIERILGVDAGLSQTAKSIFAYGAGSKVAGTVARTAGKAARFAAGAVSSAASKGFTSAKDKEDKGANERDKKSGSTNNTTKGRSSGGAGASGFTHTEQTSHQGSNVHSSTHDNTHTSTSQGGADSMTRSETFVSNQSGAASSGSAKAKGVGVNEADKNTKSGFATEKGTKSESNSSIKDKKDDTPFKGSKPMSVSEGLKRETPSERKQFSSDGEIPAAQNKKGLERRTETQKLPPVDNVKPAAAKKERKPTLKNKNLED